MLFLVQDSDRPLHIEAANWQHALERWKLLVSQENECEPKDLEEPSGIALVADDNDFLPLTRTTLP
jgi:hypothetical protein